MNIEFLEPATAELYEAIVYYNIQRQGSDHFKPAIKTKRQPKINLQLPSLSSIFNI
jgi:hypothetical protein